MARRNTLRRKPNFSMPNTAADSSESESMPLLRPASADFSDTSSNEVASRDMSQPITPRLASTSDHDHGSPDPSTELSTLTKAPGTPPTSINPALSVEEAVATLAIDSPDHENDEHDEREGQQPQLDLEETLEYCIMELQACAMEHRISYHRATKAALDGYNRAITEVEGRLAEHSKPVVLNPLHKKLTTIMADLEKAAREAEERVQAIIGSATKPVEQAWVATKSNGSVWSEADTDSELELDKQLRSHAQPRAAGKQPAAAATAAASEEEDEGPEEQAPAPKKGKGKDKGKGKKASKLGRML